MAQHLAINIVTPAKRIHQTPISVPSHGIDGQVAAPQIIFQGNVDPGMKSEPFVASARFALGAGQSVFLFSDRMEEYREVATHRHEPARRHLLGGGADHDPVAITDRKSTRLKSSH